MQLLCRCVCGLALLGLLGCGKSDPNKDLKPVDPNAKPFKMVGDQSSGKGGGGSKGSERPPSMVK